MTAGPGGGIESLYPFLYAGDTDLDAVLAQVRQSTADKAEEIVKLRDEVAARDGDRLAQCARRMAQAFGDGGKLFTFGNGGSSTDAHELAQLFLRPPAGAQ